MARLSVGDDIYELVAPFIESRARQSFVKQVGADENLRVIGAIRFSSRFSPRSD